MHQLIDRLTWGQIAFACYLPHNDFKFSSLRVAIVLSPHLYVTRQISFNTLIFICLILVPCCSYQDSFSSDQKRLISSQKNGVLERCSDATGCSKIFDILQVLETISAIAKWCMKKRLTPKQTAAWLISQHMGNRLGIWEIRDIFLIYCAREVQVKALFMAWGLQRS
jgi:hypothetical protein